MAANKQTDRHTHTRAQCSHASVGLAQARPNYLAIVNSLQTCHFVRKSRYQSTSIPLTAITQFAANREIEVHLQTPRNKSERRD